MSMNIIDIASHQAGMNLATLFSKNKDLDGVIVKTSGGNWYTNPYADAWLKWLDENEKPFGVYHYLDEDGCNATPQQEAAHFVDKAKKWIGKATLWLDYEAQAVGKGTKYLKQVLDAVYEATGVKPGVYCSQSIIRAQDFSAIAAAGYPLWMAQYADDVTIYRDFLEHPWQSGSYAPFKTLTIHQYTSLGRLRGWHEYTSSGNLDFNIFYGNKNTWDALAGKETPTPVLKPADPTVVNAVVRGEYGNGTERVKKLEEAGYDPESVQDMVNECYAVAMSCAKYIRGNEDYINSIIYIVRNINM